MLFSGDKRINFKIKNLIDVIGQRPITKKKFSRGAGIFSKNDSCARFSESPFNMSILRVEEPFYYSNDPDLPGSAVLGETSVNFIKSS